MDHAISTRRYRHLNADNVDFQSDHKGTIGGYRRGKYRIYGRLDCHNALRHIAEGHYVAFRVFFPDEVTAITAGYRPCCYCMREKYKLWEEENES